MPEKGVMPNAEPMPPNEYLMRRSWNPNDAEFPGSVVREWKCPLCGDVRAHNRVDRDRARPVCKRHTQTRPAMEVYSVDVPLLKANGERWT